MNWLIRLPKTIFDMPNDARCHQFADYVVHNFATDSDFSPTSWAHAPDIMPVTTNGAESCHGHLNAEFNATHPNIYVFVEVLLRQQAATYVTVSSLSKSRTIPRPTREKTACLSDGILDAIVCCGLLFLAFTIFALFISIHLCFCRFFFALSCVICAQQFDYFLRFRSSSNSVICACCKLFLLWIALKMLWVLMFLGSSIISH